MLPWGKKTIKKDILDIYKIYYILLNNLKRRLECIGNYSMFLIRLTNIAKTSVIPKLTLVYLSFNYFIQCRTT